jgi:hypothetical protein
LKFFLSTLDLDQLKIKDLMVIVADRNTE